jgi:hypothetical protein
MSIMGRKNYRRWCRNCGKGTDAIFCPRCRNLTSTKQQTELEEGRSHPGDIFECKIWQGPNFGRGIRIGNPNRERFFSKSTSMVILHIDGTRCIVELTKGFWGNSPEIRVAKNDAGENFLEAWIQKHELLPPGLKANKKGKNDVILVEVVDPENEFKISLPKEGSPGVPGRKR